jgi:hypothetical protein
MMRLLGREDRSASLGLTASFDFLYGQPLRPDPWVLIWLWHLPEQAPKATFRGFKQHSSWFDRDSGRRSSVQSNIEKNVGAGGRQWVRIHRSTALIFWSIHAQYARTARRDRLKHGLALWT